MIRFILFSFLISCDLLTGEQGGAGSRSIVEIAEANINPVIDEDSEGAPSPSATEIKPKSKPLPKPPPVGPKPKAPKKKPKKASTKKTNSSVSLVEIIPKPSIISNANAQAHQVITTIDKSNLSNIANFLNFKDKYIKKITDNTLILKKPDNWFGDYEIKIDNNFFLIKKIMYFETDILGKFNENIDFIPKKGEGINAIINSKYALHINDMYINRYEKNKKYKYMCFDDHHMIIGLYNAKNNPIKFRLIKSSLVNIKNNKFTLYKKAECVLIPKDQRFNYLLSKDKLSFVDIYFKLKNSRKFLNPIKADNLKDILISTAGDREIMWTVQGKKLLERSINGDLYYSYDLDFISDSLVSDENGNNYLINNNKIYYLINGNKRFVHGYEKEVSFTSGKNVIYNDGIWFINKKHNLEKKSTIYYNSSEIESFEDEKLKNIYNYKKGIVAVLEKKIIFYEAKNSDGKKIKTKKNMNINHISIHKNDIWVLFKNELKYFENEEPKNSLKLKKDYKKIKANKNGLWLYDLDTIAHITKSFDYHDYDLNDLFDDLREYEVFINDSGFWFYFKENTKHLYHINNNFNINKFELKKSNLKSNKIIKIISDNQSGVWIATENEFVHLIKLKTKEEKYRQLEYLISDIREYKGGFNQKDFSCKTHDCSLNGLKSYFIDLTQEELNQIEVEFNNLYRDEIPLFKNNYFYYINNGTKKIKEIIDMNSAGIPFSCLGSFPFYDSSGICKKYLKFSTNCNSGKCLVQTFDPLINDRFLEIVKGYSLEFSIFDNDAFNKLNEKINMNFENTLDYSSMELGDLYNKFFNQIGEKSIDKCINSNQTINIPLDSRDVILFKDKVIRDKQAIVFEGRKEISFYDIADKRIGKYHYSSNRKFKYICFKDIKNLNTLAKYGKCPTFENLENENKKRCSSKGSIDYIHIKGLHNRYSPYFGVAKRSIVDISDPINIKVLHKDLYCGHLFAINEGVIGLKEQWDMEKCYNNKYFNIKTIEFIVDENCLIDQNKCYKDGKFNLNFSSLFLNIE